MKTIFAILLALPLCIGCTSTRAQSQSGKLSAKDMRQAIIGMNPNFQPAAAPSQTNVNIAISGPYTDPDNPGWVTWVLSTTQLSNHVLSIERSTDSGFSWSQSALWFCYGFEQPVGGFFQVKTNDTAEAFYRSINTPCTPEAARKLPAIAKTMAKAPPTPLWIPRAPKLSRKLQDWRSKDGLRFGQELPPQKFGKIEFRRFLLVK